MMKEDETVRDGNLQSMLLGTTLPFYLCAALAFIFRMSIRHANGRLGMDDFFASAALVDLTGFLIVYSVAITFGLGRHQDSLSTKEIVMQAQVSLYTSEFYVWGVTFVKISMACILLRVQTARKWHIGLYVFIGAVAFTALFASFVDYLQCKPTRALWDFSFPRSKCASRTRSRNFMYVASGLFMTADVIISCLPYFMVRKMRLKPTDRYLVSFLMGLGIITTAAIIPKILSIRSLGTSDDISRISSQIDMWSFLELSLGLFACCIPALKKPLERHWTRLKDLRLMPNGVHSPTRDHDGTQQRRTLRTWINGIETGTFPNHMELSETSEQHVLPTKIHSEQTAPAQGRARSDRNDS